MTSTRLTTPDYWESTYTTLPEFAPLNVDGFRSLDSRRIVDKIGKLIAPGSQVLEVGAGNSAFLTYLARTYPTAAFTGLDYSQAGCDMLRRRAEIERVTIRVFNEDVFNPHPSMLNAFDAVYSIGVVEHFSNLSSVLVAMRRLLAPHGRMLTVIPNMAGVLGTLTRLYSREVYDLHVPHDLGSFLQGHVEAGLEVESSGYVCSNNFGVLAACFKTRSGLAFRSYVWLSRLTKALWSMEDRFGELPHSCSLSPYLFAISKARPAGQQ